MERYSILILPFHPDPAAQKQSHPDPAQKLSTNLCDI
jgi:hypothetical protein